MIILYYNPLKFITHPWSFEYPDECRYKTFAMEIELKRLKRLRSKLLR